MLLLLAAFGLAWIIGFSTISLPFREALGGKIVGKLEDGSPEWEKPQIPYVGPFLVSMLECPGCFGFHMGWLYELGAQSLPGWRVTACITMGCAVAASNFILGRLTRII